MKEVTPDAAAIICVTDAKLLTRIQVRLPVCAPESVRRVELLSFDSNDPVAEYGRLLIQCIVFRPPHATICRLVDATSRTCPNGRVILNENGEEEEIVVESGVDQVTRKIVLRRDRATGPGRKNNALPGLPEVGGFPKPAGPTGNPDRRVGKSCVERDILFGDDDRNETNGVCPVSHEAVVSPVERLRELQPSGAVVGGVGISGASLNSLAIDVFGETGGSPSSITMNGNRENSSACKLGD